MNDRPCRNWPRNRLRCRTIVNEPMCTRCLLCGNHHAQAVDDMLCTVRRIVRTSTAVPFRQALLQQVLHHSRQYLNGVSKSLGRAIHTRSRKSAPFELHPNLRPLYRSKNRTNSSNSMFQAQALCRVGLIVEFFKYQNDASEISNCTIAKDPTQSCAPIGIPARDPFS
jgi:hypothetical protein